MDGATILARSEGVTFQVVSGEAMLIHMDSGRYCALNKIGTQYWEMLDGASTIGQQAATIARIYDVQVERVLRDLLELSESFAAKGLVEVVD